MQPLLLRAYGAGVLIEALFSCCCCCCCCCLRLLLCTLFIGQASAGHVSKPSKDLVTLAAVYVEAGQAACGAPANHCWLDLHSGNEGEGSRLASRLLRVFNSVLPDLQLHGCVYTGVALLLLLLLHVLPAAKAGACAQVLSKVYK
jgi:hypothetical protein